MKKGLTLNFKGVFYRVFWKNKVNMRQGLIQNPAYFLRR